MSVYIGVAVLWLWIVDGMRTTASNLAGVALAGVGIISFQPH